MLGIFKEYLNKRIDLLKLKTIEKTALSSGEIAYMLVFVFALFFFIIFLNLGVAFLIGSCLHNNAYGFLIVSGFYFLCIPLIMSVKKSFKSKITNIVIQFLTKD